MNQDMIISLIIGCVIGNVIGTFAGLKIANYTSKWITKNLNKQHPQHDELLNNPPF